MTWILTALVGALMGIFFCLLLLLLFRYSKNPFVVGPLRWQGLFHYWFTLNLRNNISFLILSLDLQRQIQKELVSDSTREKAEEWIGKQVDAYMTHTLPEKWPMVSLLIGEKTQEKVRLAISEHIRSSWQPAIESFCAGHLTNDQIRDKIIQIAQTDRPDAWSAKTWQAISATKWMILLISLFTGVLLALTGRFLYHILQTF
ncbi:MAG: hypothetical protein ACKO6Q_08575 [Bacteroidota bacterium]